MPLLIASCLVNTEQEVTSKVRIFNPFERSIYLYQDTWIGTAEEVQGEIVQMASPKTEKHTALRQVSTEERNRDIPEQLKVMYNKAFDGKTPEEKELIQLVLCKYANIFSKSDSDLGLTTLVKHTIDTGDTRPIKQPPRKVPMAFAEEENYLIKQMEENGVIRKSSSPWASPLCLVVKKNGKIRPCVDYRKLNSCLLYTSPSPRDLSTSRMPSSA